MTCQPAQSWFKTARHCASRAFRWFARWIGCLRRQHQVHPATSRSINALTHSKMVKLGSRRRIRVIHINPTKHKAGQNITDQIKVKSNFAGSLNAAESKHIGAKNVAPSVDVNDTDAEGYWFTRWNRPLKFSEACQCSFKTTIQGLQDTSEILGIKKLPIEEIGVDEDHNREQCNFSVPTPIQMNETVETVISNIIEEVLDKVFITVFHDRQEGKIVNPNSFDDYFGCENALEEISVDQQQHSKNSHCETKIHCHKVASGFHIQETAYGGQQECMLEGQPSVVTYLSSGCINPSFLGSNIDPDTFDYVISCENELAKGETSDKDACILEYDDSDSGFNTASLESTNNHCQSEEGRCCASKQHDVHTVNDLSFDLKTGKKLEICNSIGPENTAVSVSKFWSPTSLDPNGVMLKTKDNLEIGNQMAITSLNVNTTPPNGAEHNNTQVSTNDQEEQCYHTRHFTRLKPVLLFLHGVGCSADLWASLLSHFSKSGYEVLAPDMLGHGYSSAPDSSRAYTFHRLLKDVIDIFDKFVGETRMCVVIGHAYGSSLAAAVARYRAQQVSHLVLISGGGPTPLAPRTADSRPPSMSPCLQAFLKPLIFCGFRRNIIYGPCGKHIETCSIMSRGIPNYVLQHVAQGQDWSEGDSTFHRRILVPTLLVHGMQDPYVTLVQECEMERTIPRSFLELIPDAGHFAMLETPEELIHMIHCFIEWWRR